MSDDVAEYYNQNTSSFLRFGRGSRTTGSIHRALWGPDVTTHGQAMDYVHTRIITAFQNTMPARETGGDPQQSVQLADLGCGVGASMKRVSDALDADVSGVTVSAVQQRLATARCATSRRRCRVLTGDFTDPTVLGALTDRGPLDGIWMIEAYNHAHDGDALLQGIATILRPGGILAICDDIPDDRLVNGPLNRRETRRREEFVNGWHVHTFWSPEMLHRRAEAHGLELIGHEDYSNYVAVDRPRDLLVRAIAGPARQLNLGGGAWDNMRGGNALQQLSKSRLIRYAMYLFRRR